MGQANGMFLILGIFIGAVALATVVGLCCFVWYAKNAAGLLKLFATLRGLGEQLKADNDALFATREKLRAVTPPVVQPLPSLAERRAKSG